MLGEHLLGPALRRDHDRALAVAQRRLDRIGQPLRDPGLGDEPIDDRVDRVLLVLVERISSSSANTMPSTRTRAKPDLRTASITFPVLAFLSATSGANTRTSCLGELHHLVHDLLRRLLRHGAPQR